MLMSSPEEAPHDGAPGDGPTTKEKTMTHLQQLLADALAAQAEAAAEDCGADAWSAVTAGSLTAAEYWQAVSADIEAEEEDPNGHWLDRLRELVGLPPRRR